MKSLVLLVLVASCSIDHPSDALACTTQADCLDQTRSCVNGYCVVASSSGCPAGCTTCDLTAKTCAIDGNAGNNTITCPAGYHCTIACGANACRDVNCTTGSTCTLTCSGAQSCDQVQCSGSCAIACTGADSCANVDCRDACKCDVTCSGSQSCNGLRCPNNCGTSTSCSSALPGCAKC